MASVRMCYCKQKDNILRKRDVGSHNGNGHLATTASKKSVITNEAYGSSGGSPRRTSVISEKMPNTNWSVEGQPVNTILSPETSTALENAEKIVNNAKIQLMEVCGMSSIDSARRCRNTYSDLPLDNESEELLYIRELVASKFHEVTSRSETNGKASVNSEESARLTVRRIDLSAPKFRTSRRRHADWSSLGYGSDNRSCERAPPAEGLAPSKDSIENAARTRDDDCNRRASSAASTERELVRARGNACRIQTGPSVHIVDRELTKQNLADVHISPESSWAQSRANIATYTVRHGENIPENVASEPEASRALKTLRVRLDTPRQRQRERPIVAEFITGATDASNKSEKQVEDTGRNNGLIESPKLQVKDHIYAEEKTCRAFDDAKVSEHAERMMDRGATGSAAIENSRDEKLRSEPRREEQAEITSGDDTNGRYAEDRGVFDKKSDGVDKRSDENVDRIREGKRSDRSKSLLVGDASGKTSFPRCENIASRCRATTSQKPRRTIDEHRWNTTYDSHDEQRDVARDETRRSFASSCSDEAEDDLNEINLYRPHFEDFDSILSSNNKKIERTMRAVETFGGLLSKFEFAKLAEGERTLRYVNLEEFYDNDSEKSFALNEPARASILETGLKNGDLTCASETRRGKADANPQTVPMDSVGKKSSFTKDNDRPSDRSKNFVESNAYPESDASDGSRTSPKRDKTQKAKSVAHSSLSSLDKWDVTTFSNMVPALSSTRTETQDTHAKSRATTANKFSELDRPRKEHPDSIFTHVTRSLKDDAADRFVGYFLQDEKQSIERKVTSALKESAIEPATVRKLLDRLREAETIRDARRMETLDILKNILINVEKEIDRGVGNEDASNEEKKIPASQKIPASSIAADAAPNVTADLISREENAQQARTNETESRDPQNDNEHSSGLLEPRETRGSVRSARDSASSSKNLCSEGESLKRISDIRDDDDKNAGEDLENLSAKTASEKSDDGRRMATDGRDAAIAPSGNEEAHANSEKHENESTHVRDNEDPASGERRESKSIIVAADNHKDENKISGLLRSDNELQTTTDLARLDVSREAFDAVKETRVEERHENSTSMNRKESARLEGSETKNERVHSEASSAGSKFADKIAAKRNASLACTTAQENVESLNGNNVNAQQLEEKISPAYCRSADSLRDCVSLSNLKNGGSSLRDVASTNKQISPNFAGENNSTDVRGDEICGRSTTVENHRNGNEEGGLPNGAKSDNEEQSIDRTNTLRKYKINVLSSSNSSVSSALLDHDDRFSNGALSAASKKIETSSEASHSEGELYMPSSCSYSLGEVRILKKRDFIVDSTADRDSSMTVLITRSMLTSLNDSTASLLGDSGHI